MTPDAATKAATLHMQRVLDVALPALRPAVRAQLCDVTMRAAAWRASLSSAQGDLDDGLSARQLRRHLEGLDLAGVEAAVNRELWMQSRRRLPRECIVAVDLTLIPYHGELHEDEAELRRCTMLQGTTRFHAFATLNVVMPNRRYTVAVTFVKQGERTADILARLLNGVTRRGLRIKYLLADRGFCNKRTVLLLQRREIPFVIPLAIKSRAARALQRGLGSRLTHYTMAGIELPAAVVVKRDSKKPGNKYLLYLYHGFKPTSPESVYVLYGKRGGIETSYRLANQARPRTTTRRPATRLYLFAAALLLQNAWITAAWLVSMPRPGQLGRKRVPGYFSFKRFLQLLASYVERVRRRIRDVVQLAARRRYGKRRRGRR